MPVERFEGVHLGRTPEEVEEEVERGVLLTTLDRAVGWARNMKGMGKSYKQAVKARYPAYLTFTPYQEMLPNPESYIDLDYEGPDEYGLPRAETNTGPARSKRSLASSRVNSARRRETSAQATRTDSPAKSLLQVNGVRDKDILEALKSVRGSARVTDQNPEGQYQALQKYGVDLVQKALARFEERGRVRRSDDREKSGATRVAQQPD